MTGAWLDPIELAGGVPHRILVVSENREDYYATVCLCLDQGQNMEVIFKTYRQIPGQGVFDLVILFAPATALQMESLHGILARSQCRGCLLVVDGPGRLKGADGTVREVRREEYSGVVRSILGGGGR
jgi:hypothetical protein